MQQPNASPLKPPLGLPIPASPADSGFLPRREFISSSNKRPLSSFSLLTFTNNSTLRVAAFPQPVVHLLHKFFEERKLLKTFRDNKSSPKDKNNAETDKPHPPSDTYGAHAAGGGGAGGLGRNEEEDLLAEFTLGAKFWANAKSVETERLMIQILVLLNSQGYVMLSSIDFGREPGDKLTLVFERPLQPSTSTPPQQQPQSTPGMYHMGVNGSTTSHHQHGAHGGSQGSAIAPTTGSGVRQLLFGLSFTSHTSFRCIHPPLESTPGILQALRSAWPRGIETETKPSEGCYEFKLKGYSIFAEDTFQADSLALILSLLKSFQKLQFTLVASLSLSHSHKGKDFWIFSTNDTDALTPSQVLGSISASPASYTGALVGIPETHGTIGGDKRQASLPSHLRSASVDVQTPNHPINPGHQRNATTPIFGSGMSGPGGAGTPTHSGSLRSTAPRTQGSVLVKKPPSAKASPKPGSTAGLPSADPNTTPPGTGAGKTTTPPGQAGVAFPAASSPSKQMSSLPSSQSKQMGPSKSPYQQQQILYSTPSPENVLYSTPTATSPAGGYSQQPPSSQQILYSTPISPNVNIIGASPPTSPKPSVRGYAPESLPGASRASDEDGPTPPLLSSAAFRDTLSDQDRDTRESTLSGGASVMSGRSGESYDVNVMWTGGLGTALGTTVEEKEEEEGAEGDNVHGGAMLANKTPVATPGPKLPGGWIEDPNVASSITQSPGKTGRGSKEKERPFEAKIDSPQVVTVLPSATDVVASVYGESIVGGDNAALRRRKSQEAIVQTLGAEPEKKAGAGNDGWVMVNVSGDANKKLSTATPRPGQGQLRAVNVSSTPVSSSVDTPHQSAAITTPPIVSAAAAKSSEGDQGDASAAESSSSLQPSGNVHPTGGQPTATGTGAGPGKSKSGFRRLFGRDKEKKHGSDKEKTEEKVGITTSPNKRSLWGGIRKKRSGVAGADFDLAEPARASRRMTIE